MLQLHFLVTHEWQGTDIAGHQQSDFVICVVGGVYGLRGGERNISPGSVAPAGVGRAQGA